MVDTIDWPQARLREKKVLCLFVNREDNGRLIDSDTVDTKHESQIAHGSDCTKADNTQPPTKND